MPCYRCHEEGARLDSNKRPADHESEIAHKERGDRLERSPLIVTEPPAGAFAK